MKEQLRDSGRVERDSGARLCVKSVPRLRLREEEFDGAVVGITKEALLLNHVQIQSVGDPLRLR